MMLQTSMCRLMVLAALAVAVVLFMSPGAAFGQDNIFALGYYSNNVAAAPDATLRLVNDGNLSDATPAGDLCASIYVFNFDEQMAECCSCKITPNGLLTLSVRNDLTNNTLTGRATTRGVIKVISAVPVAGLCDPRTVSRHIGIRGWITHIQHNGAAYNITEEELIDSTLGAAEFADVQDDCSNVFDGGSGQGVCSCTDTTVVN